MKLYDVPRDTAVRLLEDATVPPGAPPVQKGDVLNFHHVDGMYSYNHRAGTTVWIAAWTEVEPL